MKEGEAFRGPRVFCTMTAFSQTARSDCLSFSGWYLRAMVSPRPPFLGPPSDGLVKLVGGARNQGRD
jgi:hypothetical protein